MSTIAQWRPSSLRSRSTLPTMSSCAAHRYNVMTGLRHPSGLFYSPGVESFNNCRVHLNSGLLMLAGPGRTVPGIQIFKHLTLADQKRGIAAIIREQVVAIGTRHGRHLRSAPPLHGEQDE